MIWMLIYLVISIFIFIIVLNDKQMHVIGKLFMLAFLYILLSITLIIPLSITSFYFNYDKIITEKKYTFEIKYDKPINPNIYVNGKIFLYGNSSNSNNDIEFIKSDSNYIIETNYELEKDIRYYIFGYFPPFDLSKHTIYKIYTNYME